MHVGTPRQQVERVVELLRGSAAKQQHRKQGLPVTAKLRLIRRARKLGGVMGGLTEPRMDVVAQDLGGEILCNSQLRQPCDMLEGEPVLEALEGFLDAPALVVQIDDDRGRETHGIEQVGHQHAYLAGGGNVPYQPNRGRLAIAFVIDDVVMIGGAQFDYPLGQAGAQKIAQQAKPPLPAFSTRMQNEMQRWVSSAGNQQQG